VAQQLAARQTRGIALAALAWSFLSAGVAQAARVACVGDSITLGEHNSAGNGYPEVLARRLVGQQVKNFGSSARTLIKAPAAGMPYWQAPEFAASKAFSPDVVIIMLGTNDSKTATWKGGKNSYEADARELVAVYRALASKPRVFFASSPPALVAKSTITDAVISGEMPPILKRVAAETGAGFIDVNGAFAPVPSKYFGKGDGKDIGDGIHPSDAGAALIAETVAQALLAPAAGDAGAVAEVGEQQPVDAAPSETAVVPPAAPESGGPPPAAPAPSAPVAVDAAAPQPDVPVMAPAKDEAAAGGFHCTYGSRAQGGAGAIVVALLLLVAAPLARLGRRR
jgi:lysophospholipase L1-like esterase